MLSTEQRIQLVTELRGVALRAGQRIMTIYETDFEVMNKDDKSPVTLADQEAELLIVHALRDLTPEIPIVAEELMSQGDQPDISGGTFWLVDPLDGTKEFINKRGEFTVNIALIEDGAPTLGVVYAPAIEKLYTSYGEGGAYMESPESGLQQITVNNKGEGEALIAVASRSHRTPETDEFLNDFDIAELVSAGSSLKFCLVASGEADLYPRMGPTMEWDTAAGHAIVLGAGGRVTFEDGSPFTYAKEDFRNPYFIAWGS